MFNSSSDEDEIDAKQALRLFGKVRPQGAVTHHRPKPTHSSREGRIPFPWPAKVSTKESFGKYFGKINVAKYMQIPAKFLESDSDDDDGSLSTPPSIPPSTPPSTPPLAPLNLNPLVPSLSLAPLSPNASSSSSESILPKTEEVKEVEEATEALYSTLEELYHKAADKIVEEHATIKNIVASAGGDSVVETKLDDDKEDALQRLREEYDARFQQIEDRFIEGLDDMPKPNKDRIPINVSEKAFMDRYPSIFAKNRVEYDEADLEHRLHSLYHSRRDARHDSPPHIETKEEAEHRKAEAKKLDAEAASRLAKDEVLKSLRSMKAMQRLETIIYKTKKSAKIDSQIDSLLQNYLNSTELKNMYMSEIPKTDQSKENWRQFKEDARAAFGKRKLELISEKEKSNISAFPYSSDESDSSSDEEEQSPKTPSKTMTRSVEIAKKFGEVTPAAASRVGTAASQKGSDSDSDDDDDEDYFEDAEEEKDFNPKTLKSRAMSEIMDESRSAVKNAGGRLSKSGRIDVLENLLDAVSKLKDVDRMSAIAFQPDGSVQYHGGTKSVFEIKYKIENELDELRGKSGKSGKKVSTNVATKKRR